LTGTNGIFGRAVFVAAGLLIMMLPASNGARAQDSAASSIIGFSGTSNEPIQIGAQILDVDNKKKTALLSGNVVVVQADVTLKTKKLRVDFEGEMFASDKARFTRMEALDQILVEKGDRVLTGERGLYEITSNVITVEGNVVLSQGKNVLSGSKLVVDLNTDKYRLEAHNAGEGGRVSGSFVPNSPRPGAGDAQEAPQ
jgi:lipopolysaccharide export system protein LptA